MNDSYTADRIQLCEAMGACRISKDKPYFRLVTPVINHAKEQGHLTIECVHESDLPDPFTDANDDYAVLNWARGSGLNNEQWLDFVKATNDYPQIGPKVGYIVGDYARAALEVINHA